MKALGSETYEKLTGTTRFGRQEWSASGTRFTVQRVVPPGEQQLCTGIILGAVACVVLFGVTGLLEKTPVPFLLCAAAALGALIHKASSWEVTLDKEPCTVRRSSHNKVSTQQWGRAPNRVFPYTAVVLRPRQQGWRALLSLHSFTVKLELAKHAKDNIHLGGCESREEAMALAEALSRFLGIELRVK